MAILRWALLVALVLPLRAEATLVETHPWGYRSATYDTDTGLEWLDLTHTQGWSVELALRVRPEDPFHSYAFHGFRHATRDEVCGLLEPRIGPICAGTSVQEVPNAAVREMLDLLGVTLDEVTGVEGGGGFYTTGFAFIWTDRDGARGNATVSPATAGVLDPARYDPDLGHFLVRVPEPSALMLGLVTLVAVAIRFAA